MEKSFPTTNLPFEACQKPMTLYIQPTRLHPSLDETDSSPGSKKDVKFRIKITELATEKKRRKES